MRNVTIWFLFYSKMQVTPVCVILISNKHVTYTYNLQMHLRLLSVFFSYNSIKSWFQSGNSKVDIGPSLHMVAAAEAGILTLVMTNPIWVVKTR